MPSVPFSLRIDSKIKSRLKKEAKSLNRSESYVAQLAIKQFLEASDHKRKAIDDALTQANKGRFISSKAMGAWVDSWGTENELEPPQADINTKK